MGAIGRWSRLDGIFHQIRRDLDNLGFFVDDTTVIAEDFSRLRALNLDSDTPEDIESGKMDVLQVIIAEYVQPEAACSEQIGIFVPNSHFVTSCVVAAR